MVICLLDPAHGNSISSLILGIFHNFHSLTIFVKNKIYRYNIVKNNKQKNQWTYLKDQVLILINIKTKEFHINYSQNI